MITRIPMSMIMSIQRIMPIILSTPTITRMHRA